MNVFLCACWGCALEMTADSILTWSVGLPDLSQSEEPLPHIPAARIDLPIASAETYDGLYAQKHELK